MYTEGDSKTTPLEVKEVTGTSEPVVAVGVPKKKTSTVDAPIVQL